MSIDVLNRLCKWRLVFAGWQLGTRPKGDPECDAVRDHREATIILRAEVSALVSLLVKKGIFTHEEFLASLDSEAESLNVGYAKRFPGFTATENGMEIDVEKARETMKGWRP